MMYKSYQEIELDWALSPEQQGAAERALICRTTEGYMPEEIATGHLEFMLKSGGAGVKMATYKLSLGPLGCYILQCGLGHETRAALARPSWTSFVIGCHIWWKK